MSQTISSSNTVKGNNYNITIGNNKQTYKNNVFKTVINKRMKLSIENSM